MINREYYCASDEVYNKAKELWDTWKEECSELRRNSNKYYDLSVTSTTLVTATENISNLEMDKIMLAILEGKKVTIDGKKLKEKLWKSVLEK